MPGLGRSLGGGHGNPLQYFCLENPHGQRSLVGYHPWGGKELDMTERLSKAQYSPEELPVILHGYLSLFKTKSFPLYSGSSFAFPTPVSKTGTTAEPHSPDMKTER